MAEEVAEPLIECVCEPPPPALPVFTGSVPPSLPPNLPPVNGAPDVPIEWLCDGIWVVVSVVAAALNPETLIVGVWSVNTVVKLDVPPLEAVPVTTRSALLLCVVCFVQPVGALVCWNNISVPAGNGCPADTAAVTKAVVAICVVLVPAEAVGAAGVPVNVGDADSTVLPVPVEVVTPVPPLATASVPAKVIVPDPVIGPPDVVKPVVPPDTATDVTVPPLLLALMVIAPGPFVMLMLVPAINVALVSVLPVEFPISSWPSVYEF